MEALPLTANGKVARQALPEPDTGRPEQDRTYEGPRDQIEERLIAIWEDVLGVNPIGIKDRFFDLGGHSLLAVRVMGQIEKAFGRKLRLSTIFQEPTVEHLAGILREDARESSVPAITSLVGIQEKGNSSPLFLVHGAGGGMFWGYGNLSRRLGTGQPVYGFKSRGLDGEQEFSRIEEMAAAYVKDLRVVQPHGPYYLGGYCFGGNVAFEMARQLSSAGEKIALLALMNCAPPNSRYTQVRFNPRWLARLLKNLFYWAGYFKQWTPTQRREFFIWKIGRLKEKLGLKSRQERDSDSIVRPDQIRDLVDLSSFTAEERALWETHIRALINYHPQSFAGKVHLFRSPGHPLWCSFDPDYGWGELANGGVEIAIVPGAHEKILEEPCVEVVAAELKKSLSGTSKALPITRAADASTESDSLALPAPKEQKPVLSFAQQRLWILNELEPEAPVYNRIAVARLRGSLDLEALKAALAKTLERHKELGLRFSSDGAAVSAEISESEQVEVRELKGSEADLAGILLEEENRPFDLKRGPLFRASLVNLGGQERALIVAAHEIVADDRALQIIFKEIRAFYDASCAGRNAALPRTILQNADFGAWQRERADCQAWAEHLEFWRKELKEAPALLELPTDHPRPAKQSYKAASVSRLLPKKLAAQMKEFSQKPDVSGFTVIASALEILLHRYSGQSDVVIGMQADGE